MAAKTTKPNDVTTMRLPPDLKARIKQEARREGRSASNLTRLMLEEGLARRQRRRNRTTAAAEGEGADVGSVFS